MATAEVDYSKPQSGARDLPPAFDDATNWGAPETEAAGQSFGPPSQAGAPRGSYQGPPNGYQVSETPAGSQAELAPEGGSAPPGFEPKDSTIPPSAADTLKTEAELAETTVVADPEKKAEEKFSADLKELASLEGLNVDEFSSADELKRTLRLLDKQRLGFTPQAGQPWQHAQPAPQIAPHAAAPEAQQPVVADAELQAAFAKIKEIGGDELAAPLQKLFEHLGSQTKSVQQQAAEQAQRFEQSRVQQIYDAYDAAFTSLGPQFETLFGKGGVNEVGDPECVFRRQLALQDAMAFDQSYRAAGRPVPLPALLKKAAYARFGDRITAEAAAGARRDVSDRIRNRQGQFVTKPTSREGSSKPGSPSRGPDRQKNAEGAVGALLDKFAAENGSR